VCSRKEAVVKLSTAPESTTSRVPWIAIAAVTLVFYVGVLGRGIGELPPWARRWK
jgi:hypothetical protein